MLKKSVLTAIFCVFIVAYEDGFLLAKQIGDAVIGYGIDPCCQVLNAPDIPEAKGQLVEDILQNILCFNPVRGSVPNITE